MKKNNFIVILIAVAFAAAAIYLRSYIETSHNLNSARQFRSSKNIEACISHYRQASSWHLPLTTWSLSAQEEFLNYIDNELKDSEHYLEALYQLKAGIKGSRSFLPSSTKNLSLVETKIINAVQGSRPMIFDTKVYKVNYRAQMLAQVSFWSWLISLAGLCWYGFSREGEVIAKPFFGWLGIVLVTFSAWLYALYI